MALIVIVLPPEVATVATLPPAEPDTVTPESTKSPCHALDVESVALPKFAADEK